MTPSSSAEREFTLAILRVVFAVHRGAQLSQRQQEISLVLRSSAAQQLFTKKFTFPKYVTCASHSAAVLTKHAQSDTVSAVASSCRPTRGQLAW